MIHFELVRVAIHDMGAFGVLKQDGIPFLVTLERTFERNQVVIPPGSYRCRRTMFFKHGYETYEIMGVEGHKRVLFHIGNVEYDSTGCVLLGKEFGTVKGKPGILLSRLAFIEFLKRCGKSVEILLAVKEVT